jgi:hypothetical protein
VCGFKFSHLALDWQSGFVGNKEAKIKANLAKFDLAFMAVYKF